MFCWLAVLHYVCKRGTTQAFFEMMEELSMTSPMGTDKIDNNKLNKNDMT